MCLCSSVYQFYMLVFYCKSLAVQGACVLLCAIGITIRFYRVLLYTIGIFAMCWCSGLELVPLAVQCAFVKLCAIGSAMCVCFRLELVVYAIGIIAMC